MAMRVTGMYSGLDTETIIQELVAAKQTKVDDLKKEQTKLQWKQDSWKDLNTKIYSLYNGSLNDLCYQASYMKKSTTVSNSDLVSVITKDTAMDSVQELYINKVAKAGYLTGGVLAGTDNNALTSGSKLVDKLGIAAGSKLEITVGDKATEITIDDTTTINDLVTKLQTAGVKANFDATNQRLFIGSDGTGEASDFTITANNADGETALKNLGLLVFDDKVKAAYQKYVDMGNDETEKNAAIADKTAELLKSYLAERTSLEKEITALGKTQTALSDEFHHSYEDESGLDLTDDASRTARKNELNSSITALEEELENTTEEERKTEIQAELNTAKGKLSFITGYEDNMATIATKQARVDELNAGYINADNTAGAGITNEATAYIDAKIAEANNFINNYAANKADYEADVPASKRAVKTNGQDAEIVLNGATFTSKENTFEINGLTLTVKGETNGTAVSLTTQNDVSGIYDMIKKFVKEYSTLINEIDKLYNADTAKGYEPLTDDEKEAMTDKEVEKWEEKIKGSLLRRDSTLNTVSSAMKEIMASGFSVNGENMYLSDFGIETLGYFNAADNEKNAYHINGDADEESLKTKTNTLQAMITADPDTVVDFFTQLAKKLDTKMKDLMARTDYSSINTVYDDKKMKEDYSNYTTKISEAEEKLKDYEDKWYSKFSAMETALAKMQSNSSAVTSLLGGS